MKAELTNNELAEVAEIPRVPERDPIFGNMYILEYIHKSQAAHIQRKIFRMDGKFNEVVIRAKDHCTSMGMRFVFLRPFLSNLDLDEKKHLSAY